MTRQNETQPAVGSRWFASWRAPAIAGAVLLVVFLWWILPRPETHLVPVDGSEAWRSDEAPASRQIVWNAATEIPLPAQADGQSRLFAPRLADHGGTLYFTVRDHTGQADLYRAFYRLGQWTDAEPVAELSTPSDEIGPSLSRDGQQLYFYSNRPGGQGGYDLYVADRNAGERSWSAPRNLGPVVNTAADEYDPAIAPDGLTLLFASNRLRRTETDGGNESGQPADDWQVTIRARRDLFDLYLTRQDTQGRWQPGEVISALSEPDSHEGAPFVSPDGAFVYFSSDRRIRAGEAPNLDLYRARWTADGFGEPENLGSSVNTAAHETEPALSPEGFTLVFASDRSGSDRVYLSAATEVVHQTRWRSAAAGGIWWMALLLTLLVAALIAALLYSRGYLLQRVYVSRFFLGSVVVHLLLFLLLALWTFPKVYEMVVVQQQGPPVGAMPQQTGEQSREAYERVADVSPVEQSAAAQTSAVPARPLDPSTAATLPKIAPQMVSPQPTNRTAQPLALRRLPAPVQPPAAAPDVKPFTRRQPMLREAPLELAEIAPVLLEAVDAPADKAFAPREIDAARTRTETSPGPLTPPRRPSLRLAAARPAVLSEPDIEPVPPVSESDPPQPPRRNRNAPVPALAGVPPEEVPLPQAPEPQAESPLASRPVEVPRRLTGPTSLPESPDVPLPAMPARPVARPVELVMNDTPVDDALIRSTEPADAPVVQRRGQLQPEAVALNDDFALPPNRQLEPASLNQDLTAREIALARSTPAEPDSRLPQMEPNADDRPALKTSAAVELEPELTPAELARFSPLSPASRPLPRQDHSTVRTIAALDADELPLAPGAPTDAAEESALTSRRVELDRQPEPNNRPAELVASLTNEPRELVRKAAELPAIELEAADVSPETPSSPRPRRRSAPASTEVTAMIGQEEIQPLAAEAADVPDVAEREPAERELARVELTQAGLMAEELADELSLPGRTEASRRFTMLTMRQRNDDPRPGDPVGPHRRRPSTTHMELPTESPGMQSLLVLRQGDIRQKFIEQFGGSDETEKSVRLGLDWLAKHQNPDGSWSLHAFHLNGNESLAGSYDPGTEQSDTAGTGLALLPFLAAGNTHLQGEYLDNVTRGLDWLVEHQKVDGDLFVPGNGQSWMYSHGIAAIALCEAHGMTKQDGRYLEPAKKAIAFIQLAQNPTTGGWRYRPWHIDNSQQGDTSVVGWQVMALKSAEMAGLTVKPETYARLQKWLKFVESKPDSGLFGYASPGASPAMTAEALLCLQFTGINRNNARMIAGADYLRKLQPREEQALTSYGWYYMTQVMYHMQGDYWEEWRTPFYDLLTRTQEKNGHLAGSWKPRDSYEKRGGRLYATVMKLLMLEVFYRHLPLYEQLDD